MCQPRGLSFYDSRTRRTSLVRTTSVAATFLRPARPEVEQELSGSTGPGAGMPPPRLETGSTGGRARTVRLCRTGGRNAPATVRDRLYRRSSKNCPALPDRGQERPATDGPSLIPMDGHIGVDESGKGDFFGPLVIAACYVGPEHLAELEGVKDSKKLTDPMSLRLSTIIMRTCPHSIIAIGPAKYNELYEKFRNLNK